MRERPHSAPDVGAMTQRLRPYGLGRVLEAQLLADGTTQVAVRCRVAGGNVVVRMYPTRTREYVCFEVDVMRQLASVGFACPRPLADNRGEWVGENAGEPYAVFGFVPGKRGDGQGLGVEVAAEVGRMHTLARSMQFACTEARERYEPERCIAVGEAALATVSDVTTDGKLGWLEDELARVVPPATLPSGLCHCDLNASNFLYRGGSLVAMLDFDMAAEAQLLYDVANLLYWWANPIECGGAWSGRARRLLAAYERVRPLTEEERWHLFDMMVFGFLFNAAWYLGNAKASAADEAGVLLLRRLGREAFYEAMFGMSGS